MILKKRWLVLIIIAVVVAIAIIALTYIFSPTTGEVPVPLTGEKEQNITPPVATGDIDEATNAIILETIDESFVFNEEDNDINLLLDDQTEISDFGQSINEQDF